MTVKIIQGDCRQVLKTLPDCSVNCCVTSPPYFGLRDYGTAKWEGGNPECDHFMPPLGGTAKSTLSLSVDENGFTTSKNQPNKVQYKDICRKCGAKRIDSQIGLGQTPDDYVNQLVIVFREVKRVLKDDGTLWLNLGDSYGTGTTAPRKKGSRGLGENTQIAQDAVPRIGGMAKQLVGIPWLVAFALRADGWYLRQDIIWCLSGGTYLYARTQKGDMPIMVRDLARLKNGTVKLWNGSKWTKVLGMNRSKRCGTEIEIVLRSGERISCTPNHKFPTKRGLIESGKMKIGDILQSVILPQREYPKDCAIDEDAAWFAGLYAAEGSKADDTIQITGHSKDAERLIRLRQVASKFGGTLTFTNKGNVQNIRLYGKILNAILDELVTGHTAHDKAFSTKIWQYSNLFLSSILCGYLDGDGCLDEKNMRWRLGFCRNYNLERDLRCICARIGSQITLKLSHSSFNGKKWPSFRGETRYEASKYRTAKDRNEVIEIRKARCRDVYDIGVEDDPHTFALASGILTHNSKPNPMPESVTDRCTKSHEYIFLLSKSRKYYYDQDTIKEMAVDDESYTGRRKRNATTMAKFDIKNLKNAGSIQDDGTLTYGQKYERVNKRSVWTVTTKPYKESHFATFPPDLIRPCILAGCPVGGTVLDPFGGSGTVGEVSEMEGRNSILIELNPKYIELINNRTAQRGLFC